MQRPNLKDALKFLKSRVQVMNSLRKLCFNAGATWPDTSRDLSTLETTISILDATNPILKELHIDLGNLGPESATKLAGTLNPAVLERLHVSNPSKFIVERMFTNRSWSALKELHYSGYINHEIFTILAGATTQLQSLKVPLTIHLHENWDRAYDDVGLAEIRQKLAALSSLLRANRVTDFNLTEKMSSTEMMALFRAMETTESEENAKMTEKLNALETALGPLGFIRFENLDFFSKCASLLPVDAFNDYGWSSIFVRTFKCVQRDSNLLPDLLKTLCAVLAPGHNTENDLNHHEELEQVVWNLVCNAEKDLIAESEPLLQQIVALAYECSPPTSNTLIASENVAKIVASLRSETAAQNC